MRRSVLIPLLLAGYGLTLLGLALWPTQAQDIQLLNLRPLHSIRVSLQTSVLATLINVVGNIVAFLPFGLLPAALHPRWRSTLAAGLLGASLSLAIEVAQWLFSRRVTDIDDVILNTLGAVMGYLGYQVLSRSIGSQSRPHRAPKTH